MKASLFAIVTSAVILSACSTTQTSTNLAGSSDHPLCSDTNNLVFLEHPFGRRRSAPGSTAADREKWFETSVEQSLPGYEASVLGKHAIEFSLYYAKIGDLRKLRNLTPVINRLFSEEFVFETVKGDPSTYETYLKRFEGIAKHNLHLWQATGKKQYLYKATKSVRQQLEVWQTFPTSKQYEEFVSFVTSIVPPSQAQTNQGRRLPGAGTRSAPSTRVFQIDRQQTADWHWRHAKRMAAPILLEALVYLDDIELSDQELEVLKSYHYGLKIKREDHE